MPLGGTEKSLGGSLTRCEKDFAFGFNVYQRAIRWMDARGRPFFVNEKPTKVV
jgi:hypothetical protein